MRVGDRPPKDSSPARFNEHPGFGIQDPGGARVKGLREFRVQDASVDRGFGLVSTGFAGGSVRAYFISWL